MKIHKVAGIDIGSNSVRLLVSNVMQHKSETIFKKSSLTRLPIRLGTDAFNKGKITKKTAQKLLTGLQAYAKIMEVHEVKYYRACATSALRESSNGAEIVQHIKEETGIEITLIDGAEEARMIFNTDALKGLKSKADNFLYIDVGGGSTELTFFNSDKIMASHSFKVGTIRLLNGKVQEQDWNDMKKWIKKNTRAANGDILMIGSGGNINRVLKIAQGKSGNTLKIGYLEEIAEQLARFTVNERIIKFDLNPDRADVITHALDIYISVMNWAGAEKMAVPKKGLADGIVKDLYEQHLIKQ